MVQINSRSAKELPLHGERGELAAMDSNKAFPIGGWEFDPLSGELRRNGEYRRLEPRAAQTLKLLCEAGGRVVTHDQLIERVWGGRKVSENSISIVIGQLRRAIDDESRKLLENVPKRGYRLTFAAANNRLRPRPRRSLAAMAAVFISLLVAVGVVLALRNSGGPIIAVQDVRNETGNSNYAAHARATSELLVHELRRRGFSVHRDGSAGEIVLRPRLVMWDGKPFLSLTATDRAGEVRWSAMVRGEPANVPTTASRALEEFKAQFETG